MKAIKLMRRGVRQVVNLKCLETNEVASIRTWSESIASAHGLQVASVMGRLYRVSKAGGIFRGLRFVRVVSADDTPARAKDAPVYCLINPDWCRLKPGHDGRCEG